MNYKVESLKDGEKPFQSLLFDVDAKNRQKAINKHETEFPLRKVIAVLETCKYKKMI